MSEPRTLSVAGKDEYVFPMSFAQQRLWFLAQLEPESPFYNIPLAVQLRGPLNVEAVRLTFEEIVRRHEILRTTFTMIDGQPVQIIRSHQPPAFTVRDIGDCPDEEHAAVARRLATEESWVCFDLTKGPLLRATLLRMNERHHVLLMIIHHIIFDRWSADILIRDFAQGYAALATGGQSGSSRRSPALPPLAIQYADFTQWQRDRLQGDRLVTALAYWTKQLAGAPSLIELPTDRPRPAVQTYRGARHAFSLPTELTSRLTALSLRHEATLFMTLLAAFQILLFRYTRESDFCIGTPVANRSRLELEGLIGFFVNSLVLRANLSGNPEFHTLLARVRDLVLDAQAHQDVPFEHVVDALQPARHLSHAPLFQIMFTLQTPSPQLPSLPGLTLEPLDLDHGIAQFDLSLEISVEPAGLHGVMEYSTDLFDEPTIAGMASHFRTLLESIVARPDVRIADLPLLQAEERQQLLVEWNAVEAVSCSPQHSAVSSAAFSERCLHQLFEDQTKLTPDAIAIVADGRTVTYATLNTQADQLAQALRRHGVGPEERVGLCVERSPDMLVGLLGILKAGGAYVPLDPTYPRERLAHILNDAEIRVVVTQHRLLAELPITPSRTLCLDRDVPLIMQEEATPLVSRVGPDNAAYLIYTSGSTGRPKGVVIPHGAAVNYVMNAVNVFGLGQRDRVLQFASISFDASAEEIYPTLASGATLVLRTDQMIESVSTFMQTCQDWGITVLDLPTMYWHEITARFGTELRGVSPSVRLVIIGGEQALSERVVIWNEYAGETTLLNTYGPTETTIVATLCELSRTGRNADRLRQVPIGRPIPNVQTYVLDESWQPVPIGVPGELYIGGAGLARGYVNRPELTAERFIPNPFSEERGSRLYRTGDRARYLSDGTLEYLGRLDDQVKLRGFRIELGEIEAQLREQPGVREAVVQVREDRPGQKRLVAYAVAESAVPASDAVRRGLQRRLPDYMVPSVMVWLAALPQTPNGKVDRRALPVPEEPGPATGEAPRTPTEAVLGRIWAQVVGRAEVGLHDNFFELGGDSILSLQVIARAREAGLVLTPRQLFQHQTVAELAAVADRAPTRGATPPGTPALVPGPVPLTPIQQWFFEQAFPNPHHWNQAVLLEVRQPLILAALEAATAAVVRHHDALRLRFTAEGGGWRQQHAELSEVPLVQREDLSPVPADAQRAAMERAANQWQASLHLGTGPLLRVVWFDTGRPESRLLLIVHHLVIDGVSWRILLEDLQTAYQHAVAGQPIRLPAKTTAFSHWAAGRPAAAAAEPPEAGYWLARHQAMGSGLPVEEPSGARHEAVAETVSGALSEADTQALLQAVPAAYRTQIQDVLLTAFAQTLGAWLDRETIAVTLEGHGREALAAELDVSRTIGWFTSLYPVVLTLPRGTPPGAALKTIKEQLRRIPRHGIGYGLVRYGDGVSDVARQLRAAPLPPVCFNYLGQFDQTLAAGAAWVFARESVGREHDPGSPLPYELEVNAAVVGGRLEVSWTYSGARYRRATLEALSGRYLAALQHLIAHCLAPDTGGYTPSDFPDIEIEQDALDAILKKMD